MNDFDFCNSFVFAEICFQRYHHTDNTHGISCHYFGFLKKGTCLVVSNNEKININEGDWFYLPKDLKYHSYWSSEDSILFDSFGFKFAPIKQKFKAQKLDLNNALRHKLAELSKNKEVSLYSVGLLYSLFDMLLPQMQIETMTPMDEIVQKSIEIMHLSPLLKISDVAKTLKVSETVLYSAFKRSIDKTPNSVRQEICCQNAIDLLSTTDLSVEEISFRAGFSSSSYFRKILFSVTGKTPRQIRSEAKTI